MDATPDAKMDPKQRAAAAALRLVESGMTLGLGTGSTARWFIDGLGAAIAAGQLKNIRGVPTSVQSDEQARGLGIPVVTFADVDRVDITVDGADEIDPQLSLIKGLGGALLREKIVAQNSDRLVIIADGTKVVTKLGTKGPLPVEIAPFSLPTTERFLKRLGCVPVLRHGSDGKPYVTDNGNLIFDCRFDGIDDPAGLNATLHGCAGVVETGLFVGIAKTAFVADAHGNVRELRV